MEVERDLAVKNRKAEPRVEVDDDDDNESEEVEAVNTSAQNPKLLSSIYNYLVVLSIILIIFAAFRNSVTWWVALIWSAEPPLNASMCWSWKYYWRSSSRTKIKIQQAKLELCECEKEKTTRTSKGTYWDKLPSNELALRSYQIHFCLVKLRRKKKKKLLTKANSWRHLASEHFIPSDMLNCKM